MRTGIHSFPGSEILQIAHEITLKEASAISSLTIYLLTTSETLEILYSATMSFHI